MSTPDRLNCDVWQIVFPDWKKLIDEKAQGAIWNVFRTWADFEGVPPSRKGFVGISRVATTIVGFYIQEDLRVGLQGDSPESLHHNQQANFEKLFFAFVLDDGLFVLQRTNLSGYVAMNYTSMRNDFISMLTLILNRAGIPVAKIIPERFYRKRSQEEMRQIFLGNLAVEMNVTDLNHKTVPESVQLSNPDPKEEEILKRIFNRDYENIDDENLRAAFGKDLRLTKTGKAAAHTGIIRKVTVRLLNGDPETFQEEQDEKIDVPVDDNKEHITADEARNVIEIVERRVRIPAHLLGADRPLSDLGPLFSDWQEGKHGNDKA